MHLCYTIYRDPARGPPKSSDDKPINVNRAGLRLRTSKRDEDVNRRPCNIGLLRSANNAVNRRSRSTGSTSPDDNAVNNRPRRSDASDAVDNGANRGTSNSSKTHDYGTVSTSTPIDSAPPTVT